MENQINKVHPVTTKQAMEILNCCRTTFNLRHKPKLKQYHESGQTHFCYYDREEVENLAIELNKDKNVITGFNLSTQINRQPKPIASMEIQLINGKWHVDGRSFNQLTPNEIIILDNFFEEYKNGSV